MVFIFFNRDIYILDSNSYKGHQKTSILQDKNCPNFFKCQGKFNTRGSQFQSHSSLKYCPFALQNRSNQFENYSVFTKINNNENEILDFSLESNNPEFPEFELRNNEKLHQYNELKAEPKMKSQDSEILFTDEINEVNNNVNSSKLNQSSLFEYNQLSSQIRTERLYGQLKTRGTANDSYVYQGVYGGLYYYNAFGRKTYLQKTFAKQNIVKFETY